MGPLLDDLTFDRLEKNVLSVSIRGVRSRRTVEHRREAIAKIVGEALGRPVRVEIGSDDAPAAQAPEPGASETTAAELPLVRQAMDLFDAQIVSVEDDVEPPPPAPREAGEHTEGS